MTTRAPLVSVIVPCFNAAPFIATAMRSIQAQSVQDTEIIVIDDGSADRSREVVSSEFPTVLLVEQQNLGAAAARNAGIRASKGRYVAFLDADDWWHERKLETQLAHMDACGECGAVYANWRECTAPDREPWLSMSADTGRQDSQTLVPELSGWIYRRLLADCVIHTSSVLFRRDVLDHTGYFREDLKRGQDLEFWIRASRIAPIHKLAAVLSAYRIYDGSATTRVTTANYRALIIEEALAKWGLADPTGNSADPERIRLVLRNSWTDFGYAHLTTGSPRVALQSFARAQAYGGSSLKLRQLQVRAKLKSLFEPSGAALDPRHARSTAPLL